MILTADWHLVDDPREEYRWKAFDELFDLCMARRDELFILGDLCDRADKHSGKLVNRIVDQLAGFADNGVRVTVLMGNHDMPLSGEPYWKMLNKFKDDGIRFVWKPEVIKVKDKHIALLPYAAAPETAWKEFIDYAWKGVDMIFMHQPVDGVLMENGSRYSTIQQLPLPSNIPIFSGDIHTPQRVRNVVYVGAPHVIKYGDMYTCRVLQISTNTDKVRKYFFHHPHRKWMLRGSSVDDIRSSNEVLKGHQAKVEFALPIADVDKWPGIQADLRLWAADVGFDLTSTEAIINMGETTVQDATKLFESNAEALRAFAKGDGVPNKVLRVGLSILAEVENENG